MAASEGGAKVGANILHGFLVSVLCVLRVVLVVAATDFAAANAVAANVVFINCSSIVCCSCINNYPSK